MALDFVRIQNKLVDLGRAGPFYAVAYGADGKATAGAAVDPSEVVVNEVASSFGLPERSRRGYQLDRGAWTWELRLGFNQDVLLEQFERAVLGSPIQLPANKALGERQVSLELQSVQHQHPPQQGAKTTKVTYLVNARLWPL